MPDGVAGLPVRIVDIHGVDLGGAVLGTVALDAASLAALEAITNQAATSGGATPFRLLNVGTTGQVIKNGAGQLYELDLSSTDTAVVYVKLYDKATAPTSADTPVFVTMVPIGPAGRVIPIAVGGQFTNGISVRVSALQADADNTAPGANTVQVSGFYK